KEVILPIGNERDVNELPKHIVTGFRIHYATHYRDVFDMVFRKNRN
ncbi:MAG: ATP-dependent protease La, partial [Gammaproteobacteria bacterium]